MINSFQKTLAGSVESLTDVTAVRSGEFWIQADSTNSGIVVIGGATGQFWQLAAGESIAIHDIGDVAEKVMSSDDIQVNGTAADLINVIYGI